MKLNLNTIISTAAISMGAALLPACSKLVEVASPITSTSGENVFNEDASAIAAITGIYTNMSFAGLASTDGYLTNICFLTGLTGDELALYKADDTYGGFYTNEIPTIWFSWANVYQMIFIANSALEQLPKGTLLSPVVRDQLMGEAKFVRALCYLNLVNLHGDVPLALTTDTKVNAMLPRTTVTKVYEQIIADLKDAVELLNDDFTGKNGHSTTTERVRPGKWAAMALLARTYLYSGNYPEAERLATEVINNTRLFGLENLNNVFLMNNREAIWQLQPVGISTNGNANPQDGMIFQLESLPSSHRMVHLTDTLVKSFDERDMRKTQWIRSLVDAGKTVYFPYKYKLGLDRVPTAEYATVLRLGEQYLIRAEARIRQDKVPDGIADLNIIRDRATDHSAPPAEQLPALPSTLLKTEALLAVENERKLELFTEWGHRWFDLKRTGRIDAVLQNIKSGWETTDQLFPLPVNDVNQNPNIKGHQNPGY